MKKLLFLKILFSTFLVSLWVVAVNTTIDDFFLPGSQPDSTRNYDSPSNCANCHSGIKNNTDISYEPTYGWQGSMMSQAMRDPLYLASLTIANQDAEFAGDLCIRCHAPAGWLSGRSEPTDGSQLTSVDTEGVDCHFCHELINPNSTNANDLIILDVLEAAGKKPSQAGNGMFVVESDNKRRHGPFNDADPKSHQVVYDAYYSESAYCGTCHDVSNPAFTKNGDDYVLNTLGEKAPSFNTYDMFPVERTYSEWKMSAYNSPTGIKGTVFGGNKTSVSSCQDCHMQDVTGYGCNKNGVLLRNDLPMHDMTGGNTFVPLLIKQLYATDPSVNTAALDAGIIRARKMLQNAASLNVSANIEDNGYELKVKVTNETGHKLPSGYPEGRRMWIQVIAKNSTNEIIYESGSYNLTTAVLEKKDTKGNDTKIYEAKLAMSANPTEESFHFALNNVVLKDNRIPPRGFTNANFEAIQSPPVNYTYEDGEYYDETEYDLPLETKNVQVKLLYQTTSKEYIEFLRDENTTNNAGIDLYNLWTENGKSTPEIMNELSTDIDKITLAFEDLNHLFIEPLLIYPNPTNEALNISFKLKNAENISIEVYDMSGRKIKTLLNSYQSEVEKNIKWNITNISSGMYIVKFKMGNKLTSKIIKIN